MKSDISSDHRLVWLDLTITGTAVVGDANYDGVVNVMDMRYVATNMQQPASACPTCDINEDGTINVLDLRALAVIIQSN